MTNKTENLDLEKISFEEALDQLEKITNRLGSQKINLEEMVTLYEQATILKNHCNKKITDAKMKVDLIMKDS